MTDSLPPADNTENEDPWSIFGYPIDVSDLPDDDLAMLAERRGKVQIS